MGGEREVTLEAGAAEEGVGKLRRKRRVLPHGRGIVVEVAEHQLLVHRED